MLPWAVISIKLTFVDLALPEFVKDGLIVNLITVIFDSWSGCLIAQVESASADKHLSVSRVGFVLHAVLLHSHDPVQQFDLFVAVGC